MPFIRYSRDKRGYETTVVMHAYRSPQGSQRSRVLYVFRSPSSLKVGRRALDEEVMEALEHTHPDLTFDWSSLQRDMGSERPEPREREQIRRPPPRRTEQRPPAPQESAPLVVVDESALGRALGAPTAARLRNQYNDLSQRISRRARTPEERERLIERLTRLNPDDWLDDAAIRANAQGVEAEWAAIAAELPQRRRGRRGGRQRREGWVGRQAAEASGIMAEQGESDAADNPSGVAGEDRSPDAAGDSSRDSAGHEPEHTAADTDTSDDPDPTARLHEDG